MANMEWDIPNQSDTKHRLGSITKQFTAMLILQLVNGKAPLVTLFSVASTPTMQKKQAMVVVCLKQPTLA